MDVETPEGGCKVSIIFDLQEDLLTISDNGRGISKEDMDYLVNVNASKKSESQHFTNNLDFRRIVKGHAGIGVKSTIYSSSLFRVETIKGGKKTIVEIQDGCNFKEWDTEKEFPIPTEDCAEHNGTKIEIKFPTNGDKPRTQELLEEMFSAWLNDLELKPKKIDSFDSFGFTTPRKIKRNSFHVIQWFLQTRTYVGCITRTLGDVKKAPDVEVNVEVILPKNKSSIKILEDKQRLEQGTHSFNVEYWSPDSVLSQESVYGAANKSIKRGRRKVNVPQDIAKIYDQKAQHGYYFELILPKNELIKFLQVRNKSLDQDWIKNYVNGVLIWISKSNYIRSDLRLPANGKKGFISHKLCANGIPTTSSVPFDSTLPAVHLVLDLDVKVTPSKDSYTGSLHHNTEKFKVDNGITQFCDDLKTSLVPLIRKVANIQAADQHEEKKKSDQSQFEIEVPTDEKEKLALQDLFNRKSAIKKENDVIQAFSSYCSKIGIDMGWMALDGGTLYDAASGQQEFVRTAKIKRKDAEYAVIEFKSPRSGTSLSLVHAQINGEEQNLEGVDYIVCWTDPTGQDLEEGYHVLERSEDPWGENAEMYQIYLINNNFRCLGFSTGHQIISIFEEKQELCDCNFA